MPHLLVNRHSHEICYVLGGARNQIRRIHIGYDRTEKYSSLVDAEVCVFFFLWFSPLKTLFVVFRNWLFLSHKETHTHICR